MPNRVPAAGRRAGRHGLAGGAQAHGGRRRGGGGVTRRRRRVIPPENQEASWSDVDAGGRARPRGGLPPDPDGRRGPGRRAPKRIRGLRKKFARDIGFLVRAGASATTSSSSPTTTASPQGRRDRYRQRLSGAVHGHQPGPCGGPARGRETTDPPRPARGVDRRRHQREQAHARLHGGGCQHRGGHPPQPRILSHAAELLGRTGDPGPARTIAKDKPQAGRDLVPKLLPSAPCSGCCRTCSTRASTSATCAASSRCWPSMRRGSRTPGAHLAGAPGSSAGPSSRGSSGQRRGAGDGPRPGPRAGPDAGHGWRGGDGAIEPGLADTLLRETAAAAQRMRTPALPAVLLVPRRCAGCRRAPCAAACQPQVIANSGGPRDPPDPRLGHDRADRPGALCVQMPRAPVRGIAA